MLEYKNKRRVNYGTQGFKTTKVTAICFCGKEFEVRLSDLKGGKQKSCGCLRGEIHPMNKTRIYNIWANLKQRCLNKKSPRYKDYGGRGINLCKDWLKFSNFYEDMKEGYSKELTLDRIDNNGNYCKSNCHWITYFEQNRNQRTNVKYKGECAADASVRLKGSSRLVHSRLHLGWSKEKAFTTPARKVINSCKSS
jgi:hypothetical protein